MAIKFAALYNMTMKMLNEIFLHWAVAAELLYCVRDQVLSASPLPCTCFVHYMALFTVSFELIVVLFLRTINSMLCKISICPFRLSLDSLLKSVTLSSHFARLNYSILIVA